MSALAFVGQSSVLAWPHMCAAREVNTSEALSFLGEAEESTCGRRLAKRQLKPNKLPAAALRLAAYTYTIRSDHRSPLFDHLIPDCQSKLVDCFYYCGVNRSSAWAAKGWQIRSPTLQNGTEFISAERLTAKYYKFVLPQELRSGYDWVLSLDDNYHVNLDGLADLARAHSNSVFVLLNWSHWMRDRNPLLDPTGKRRGFALRSRSGDSYGFEYSGWAAFDQEAESMLSWRPGYIGGSYSNTVAWRERMRSLVSQNASGTRLFADYYDLSIMLIHTSHLLWKRGHAYKVLLETFEESHRIERDQFLLPYYLWRSPSVHDATAVVKQREIFKKLCRCAVFGPPKTSSSTTTRRANETILRFDGSRFRCWERSNYRGKCVKHAPCPILVKSLSACQAACARASDCRSLVFNRYSQCFLKTTDNDHVVEPTMQHGTIGCVYNRPPKSVDYAQYEKKQASKLDAISDQIRAWDRLFERQLLARLLRQRHLVKTPVLCVGARLGGEIRAFRAVWPRLLSIGIDFNPGQRNAGVMWGDAHSLSFSNETFGSVYTNVFDHLLMPTRFVDEARRVLAHGGTLFVDMDQRAPDEWAVRDLRLERDALAALITTRGFELVVNATIPEGEEKDAPKQAYVFRRF